MSPSLMLGSLGVKFHGILLNLSWFMILSFLVTFYYMSHVTCHVACQTCFDCTYLLLNTLTLKFHQCGLVNYIVTWFVKFSYMWCVTSILACHNFFVCIGLLLSSLSLKFRGILLTLSWIIILSHLVTF